MTFGSSDSATFTTAQFITKKELRPRDTATRSYLKNVNMKFPIFLAPL